MGGNRGVRENGSVRVEEGWRFGGVWGIGGNGIMEGGGEKYKW